MHLCGVPLERASLTGRAELVAIEADAPVVHAYGEPSTSSTQHEAVVQDFRSIGHTSITQIADRISTFIDLSQVEIPPFGQFRFVRVNADEELDHDAFEIFGIEEKLKADSAEGRGRLLLRHATANHLPKCEPARMECGESTLLAECGS